VAPVGNWSTETNLDVMKRRGWIEHAREPIPHERRILVRLWHPRQTVGEGCDRYYTAVETFRSLPLDEPGPSQLTLFGGLLMLLLATQAEPQMRAHRHPNLGRLLQPRHYPRAAATARSGVPWAADNDAFNGGWDEHAERRFLRMVQALTGLPGCLFVVCPDVVGEAGLTSMLFEEYAPLLWSHGLPPAYVLQEPGVEYDDSWIPWGAMRALFIGGATTEFKLGPQVEAIVAEARSRGVWVHMGRVNSLRRLAYAASIGCDSIDGTQWVRYRDTYLRDGLRACAAGTQLRLQTTSATNQTEGDTQCRVTC
jgi:hypothetical protein